MSELVHRDDRAGGAVLTLDSPANRNALSKELVSELDDRLAQAADDPAVRAVVITATGRTFCAGADLADPPVQSGPGSFADLLQRLWTYPKPVVAALNGHVRAGGLGLVAAADVAVSVTSATFAFTEVRIGVVPAIISVLCLRRMSPADAHRFLLTGEQFDPAQARAAGLIVDVVADGELDTTIDALLGQFRLCQPEALRQTRELLHTIPQMDVDAGFARAHAVSRPLPLHRRPRASPPSGRSGHPRGLRTGLESK
jgi:methylglutaconyl-CoA hydratase